MRIKQMEATFLTEDEKKIKKSQNAVIKSSPVRDKGIRCFPREDKWYVVRVSSQEDGGD